MSPKELSGPAASESKEPVINAGSQAPPSAAGMVSFMCQLGSLKEGLMGKASFLDVSVRVSQRRLTFE